MKVRRPGVVEAIERDCNVLCFLASSLSFIPLIHFSNAHGTVQVASYIKGYHKNEYIDIPWEMSVHPIEFRVIPLNHFINARKTVQVTLITLLTLITDE